MKVLMSQHM